MFRAVLGWANRHALRTDISFRDNSGFSGRKPADKTFEEVVSHVGRRAKSYFRVILRRNQNWFLLLTDKKHIEDIVEIGIGGVEIGTNEYFIHCFLKKEFVNPLRKKFRLTDRPPQSLQSVSLLGRRATGK